MRIFGLILTGFGMLAASYGMLSFRGIHRHYIATLAIDECWIELGMAVIGVVAVLIGAFIAEPKCAECKMLAGRRTKLRA